MAVPQDVSCQTDAIWQQIAQARPALNPQIVIRRQRYADEIWYLLQDPISERHFRLSPEAYHLIDRFNGERSLEEIWQAAQNRWQDPPSQSDFIRLLMQLQGVGALQEGAASEPLKLLERRKKPRQWLMQLRNPLSLRLPLWDPDKLLDRLLPLVQPMIGRTGLVIWLLLVVGGLLQAAVHWQEISFNITSQLLSAQNLALMGLAYFLMKALHELAHGIAVKHWGGEVHQVGVLFLALIPMPYVDASAASGFAERRARMAVGAAGIMVELALACMALWLWLATEQGLVSALAYNMMLIGGVSTLLVNGNPLLKFDGYYVFSDLLDIPNLSTRSNRYLGYLVQYYLFGLTDSESPANSSWERGWFLCYGIAAFCYRIFILLTIALFVAERYPVVGKLLALWALVGMLAIPVVKQFKFLLTSKRLANRRPRAMLVTGAIVAGVSVLLFLLPAPHATQAQGVVMPPEGAEVRAGAEGRVVRLLVSTDTPVAKNQPLIELSDPFQQTKVESLQGRVRELYLEYKALKGGHENVQAEMLQDEIALVEADLARQRLKIEALTVRSPSAGRFYLQQPDDLPGSYLDQGALIGYVIDQELPLVRVAVAQQDIGLIRQSTLAVGARYAARPGETLPVRLGQSVPESQQHLPSPVLGSAGGGPFPLHPLDEDGTRPLEPIFELLLYPEIPLERLGERVVVRFDHGAEPLGWQWYRTLRQLFLMRLSL